MAVLMGYQPCSLLLLATGASNFAPGRYPALGNVRVIIHDSDLCVNHFRLSFNGKLKVVRPIHVQVTQSVQIYFQPVEGSVGGQNLHLQGPYGTDRMGLI